MLSKELSEKYKISVFELNSIISKMKSIILDTYQKDDKIPTAIFTGGQPGAGKSAIVLKSKIDLAKKNKDSIVFDLDSYRGLFSKSLEIAQQYPEYFQALTNPYSGKIMEELSNMAIEEGYNFIMEGTMGKSVYTLDVLLESGKKYNIIARLLAVSREESIISMFERYILMEEKSGFGRLTTIKDHDERYENFPNIALTLEGKGVEVEVYERTDDIKNPKLTYKTSNKKVNIYDSVSQAIKLGRETSRKKCYETYEERLEYINYKFKEFNVNDGLMKELNKLNEMFQYNPNKQEKKI